MTTGLDEYKKTIEQALAKCFSKGEGFPQKRLLDAMDYSLTAGGKRLRPILVLEFCRVSGGDWEKALPIALAVEMLHTYSLIHDDLPSMDNDDLRRGKPTNHKVFGECTAILAGDALQAEAFGSILRSDLPAKLRASCAEALADAAGVDGICGGQQVDMESETRSLSLQELTDMQGAKTSSLFICACKMGVIAAGGTEKQIDAACCFGAALGSAFQIRDDMLDELSSPAELGKSIGKDKREGKTTFLTLYGMEKCAEMVANLSQYAKSSVNEAFEDTKQLCSLADGLVTRSN